MAQDYYDLLGVSRSADKAEIKTAFRKLAREFHPDVSKHADAEARFKEINEAYEVLSDDEKRARYDRFGAAGVNQGPSGFGGAGGVGFGGFEDVIEELFNFGGRGGGGGGRRRGPKPGANRKVDVTISFEESIFGVDRQIDFERLETCDVCEGSGAEPGTSPTKCPQCNGAGEVRQVQQTFLGPMVQVATCPRCNGRGEIVETPCHQCKGSGRLRHAVSLPIKIPAGVREGVQIEVRGEGDAGELIAPKGHLYVTIHVQDHEFYKRRDNDVIVELSINVAQAALGDMISAPTVDGPQDIAIPAGTQTGKVFRLRGKGVPRLRGDGTSSGRGDELVYINVEIPAKLTDDQRKLFEQLALTLGSDVQPQKNGKGFFDRVVDFFNGEQ